MAKKEFQAESKKLMDMMINSIYTIMNLHETFIVNTIVMVTSR